MAYNAPSQLILDTANLAKKKGYQVESDGRVFEVRNGKKSYLPPWLVWQGEEARLPDGKVNPNVLPGSDPNSPWHAMFSAGGPFTNRSTWDADKGTFEGSIDWLQLLTTIGAGGVIGAGVAAAASGGAAAGGAGATAAAPAGEVSATSLTGAAGVGLPAGVAPSGAVPAAMTAGGSAGSLATVGRAAGAIGQGISGATEAAANRQFAENQAGETAARTNVQGEDAFNRAVAEQERLRQEAAQLNLTGEKNYEDATYNRERLGLEANGQNIQGEQAYQSALQAIARTEADQRSGALKDVYRASAAENPSHSPYNPVPTPGMSEDYRMTLANVSRQGAERLTNPAQYDTRTMRAPVAYQPYTAGGSLAPVKPYTPYTMTSVAPPKPFVPYTPDVSTTGMQQIGNIAGPTLSTIAQIARLYYGR